MRGAAQVEDQGFVVEPVCRPILLNESRLVIDMDCEGFSFVITMLVFLVPFITVLIVIYMYVRTCVRVCALNVRLRSLGNDI